MLDNSTRVLIKHPLLVQTVYGNVCINAGIDRSNTESGYILLLPEDSDRSARQIRDRIFKLSGKTVAVIITDTNGRSFRDGQIGVAVGCAGIAALHDRRGDVDLFGHELKITIQGITDEVAACANMLMGEANEGTPIAVIRGYPHLKMTRALKSRSGPMILTSSSKRSSRRWSGITPPGRKSRRKRKYHLIKILFKKSWRSWHPWRSWRCFSTAHSLSRIKFMCLIYYLHRNCLYGHSAVREHRQERQDAKNAKDFI